MTSRVFLTPYSLAGGSFQEQGYLDLPTKPPSRIHYALAESIAIAGIAIMDVQA